MKLITILGFTIYIAFEAVQAGWFRHNSYWQCILKEMQSVNSDTIAHEVVKNCKDEYPFHERIFIEKKRPWFGVKTASQCVLKYGKKVQSEIAAKHIQAACYKLYFDE